MVVHKKDVQSPFMLKMFFRVNHDLNTMGDSKHYLMLFLEEGASLC